MCTGTADDMSAGDASLNDLAGGTETVDGVTFIVNEAALKEVLDTGLFSSRGPHNLLPTARPTRRR